MGFSDHLLELGADIWTAQKTHPFVTELADGELDPAAFEHWVRQDYRYLQDYARLFAIASTKASNESTMAQLLDVAHTVLHHEMDLHREFAHQYGIDRTQLELTNKAPTCVAYTNFLVRTAYEGSIAETVAALFPCLQGYLDIADHMADRADSEHQYTPFIEMYTGEEFRETAMQVRSLVDWCGEEYPGTHDTMEAAFLRSARLEYHFWEMAYTQEDWLIDLPEPHNG